MDRLYCTLAELIQDLGLHGVKNESQVMRHILAASEHIDRELGQFIPAVETRKIYPTGGKSYTLLVPPLLSITSIKNGDTTLTSTDYTLKPGYPHWQHGPYSEVYLESEGEWYSEGNEIVGEWGKYKLSKSLGITGSLAAVDTATLAVTDGSKLSPGMVLLIESEQLLVSGMSTTTTDSTADLAEDVDATSETEIAITDGTKLAVGEVIKVGFEQMLVLDISTNDILVERGYNGTTMAAHTSGASILVFRTFNVTRGINGTTAAIHAAKAIYQYIAPADVNYLCRQIASLMMKKAESGYVGRSGNDDLGSGFWVNEFPRNQIEAVASNYPWYGA